VRSVPLGPFVYLHAPVRGGVRSEGRRVFSSPEAFSNCSQTFGSLGTTPRDALRRATESVAGCSPMGGNRVPHSDRRLQGAEPVASRVCSASRLRTTKSRLLKWLPKGESYPTTNHLLARLWNDILSAGDQVTCTKVHDENRPFDWRGGLVSLRLWGHTSYRQR
jgi:hypothetical protein